MAEKGKKRRDTALRLAINNFIIAFLPLMLRLLGLTWGVTWLNKRVHHDFILAGKPIVGAVWHQNIMPTIWLFRDRRLQILSSVSRDGRAMSRIGNRLGNRTIWGSSSRGGREALKALIRVGKKGLQSCTIVDGPKGPPRDAKLGVIVAAHMTGQPIVVVGCHVRPEIRLRNWDGTRIPLPFSRIVACMGGPFYVPRDADRSRLEEYRIKLNELIDECERKASRRAGDSRDASGSGRGPR